MSVVPKGYRFAVVAAEFKKKNRFDLGAIVSDVDAVAAGVFTQNIFVAAPVARCKQMLAQHSTARAIVANAGQANACTGPEGDSNCRKTQELVGAALGVDAKQVLVASTGVIGAQLKMENWALAMPGLQKSLGNTDVTDVATAIMTTDTVRKLATAKVELATGTVRLLGMAKGAGMICPNMATMFGFIICDAKVEPAWWAEVLRECVEFSFNRITIDGDTSTNDTVLALANGVSGAAAITALDKDALKAALLEVCRELAYKIVQDAEGGTKVARIRVRGAKNQGQAELVARAIGNSPLVKTALFGCDPNWGRIVAAAGRSGAEFCASDLALTIGAITVFENGQPTSGNMDALLAPVMDQADIEIGVSLGAGKGEYELVASDLTRDYVSINADYRS